jgi:valyl-tRNA synthetase
VADLKKGEFLEKIEPYKLKVPVGDRSGAILEPLLTDQWFVKTKPLAKKAIEVVENGKIKFVPETWTKVYLQWLYNIEDWCISRQLIWGHRIPAWYDEKGNVYVAADEEAARTEYKINPETKLTQDSDVLDTWFSSALWPFSTLGWPEQTKELKTFYPTNVLVTGFDIIFFWVARMVMMGLKFTDEIPFKEVYITGLIRDHEGQKMSKSKGNILDPIDLVDGIEIEELIAKRSTSLMQPQMQQKIIAATKKEFPNGIKAHGMDALRFTFCALASPCRDINFDIQRLTGYRNFCNKLWNAARFVLMNQQQAQNKNKTLADQWILSRLQRVITQTHKTIENYRFDLLTQKTYEFIWHEYCDWYIELYKAEQNSNITIIEVLETLLRLVHPIMPFISEEIWQQLAPILKIDGETIMLQKYPEADVDQTNIAAEEKIEWMQKIANGVRNIRGEMNFSPKIELQLILNKGNNKTKEFLQQTSHYLTKIANIKSISWQKDNCSPPTSSRGLTAGSSDRILKTCLDSRLRGNDVRAVTQKEQLPACATFLVDDLEIYIPIEGIIDLNVEKERLNKEITKLAKERDRSQNKLNNENYVKNAPADLVQQEQQKLQEKNQMLTKLKQRLELLNN